MSLVERHPVAIARLADGSSIAIYEWPPVSDNRPSSEIDWAAFTAAAEAARKASKRTFSCRRFQF